jgi:signal transduction histidine kinase
MSMRKSTRMTAQASLAFAVLTFVLLITTFTPFGPSAPAWLTTSLVIMFVAIFVINAARLVYISSYLLCVLPSIAMLGVTIYLKSQSPGNDIHYFSSRIILVGFTLLPGMVFSAREPRTMYSAIVIAWLCVILYDPIHEAFGLGYYQVGFTNPAYYYLTTISTVVSIAIIGATLALKRIVVREEDKIASLLKELQQRNEDLETQNEEIHSQTEQLTAAFALIDTQKKQLEQYTDQLEEMVEVKSRDLTRSNDELQKYNSDLRQFSYTVSHNVRGPVARLLGLANLIDLADVTMSDDNRKMVSLIQGSALELDKIIRELSRIIDIRNDLYIVKEKIYFADEWMLVYKSLEGQITPDMQIEANFADAPFIYTIRAFLHSILYNLASNAMRYRSPQRPLKLSIRSTLRPGFIHLDVSDNGMGINLEQFGQNLFGMYKRFHTHVEGRGLGLYLVKTQVEALHGTINVESELNQGTTFAIDIQLPRDIEGQMCFDCDYGSILYNARTNIMGLSWKRAVNSEEYRTLMTKCLEMMHIYSTPHWIADLRKRGPITPDDHIWMQESILHEGSQNGLKKIACIDNLEGPGIPVTEVSLQATRYGVHTKFFHSRRDAETWIEED